MMALSHLNPDIHTEFVKWHFTVKKTSHAFSNLAIDQAHEQNNAVVKDDGGAVGLAECPAALQRWMLSGPEMARVSNDFDRAVDCALCTSDTRHHEQRPGVQKISLQDVMSLKATIDEYSNPFLETSGDLLVLDTRDTVEKSVIDNLYRIEALGCQHYDNFVSERLVERTIPIYDVMKKNNIHLFNTPHKRQKTKTSELVLSLKSDRNLFFEIVCCISVSWWQPRWMFISREPTVSSVTVRQRETQTGHRVGHCSMPRRCHRGAGWHNTKCRSCCVRRTCHRAHAEASSSQNFPGICPGCVPLVRQLDKPQLESRRGVGRLQARFRESANAGNERERNSSPSGAQ